MALTRTSLGAGLEGGRGRSGRSEVCGTRCTTRTETLWDEFVDAPFRADEHGVELRPYVRITSNPQLPNVRPISRASPHAPGPCVAGAGRGAGPHVGAGA